MDLQKMKLKSFHCKGLTHLTMAEDNALQSFTKFINEVIVDNVKYNLEDLFGFRVDRRDYFKNDGERKLLNNINDLLFNNRHQNLERAVEDVNYILSMTMYFDDENKYERVKFLIGDYASDEKNKIELKQRQI